MKNPKATRSIATSSKITMQFPQAHSVSSGCTATPSKRLAQARSIRRAMYRTDLGAVTCGLIDSRERTSSGKHRDFRPQRANWRSRPHIGAPAFQQRLAISSEVPPRSPKRNTCVANVWRLVEQFFDLNEKTFQEGKIRLIGLHRRRVAPGLVRIKGKTVKT